MKPVCAVVGVGPGLGLAIAERFGSAGHRVALLARSEPKLAGFARTLEGRGIEAYPFSVDVARFEDVATALAAVEHELGAPEVLVYNAVALRRGKPSTLAPEGLLDDLRVNVVGALASVQAVLPSMRARGRGTILLTGGGLALEPLPDFAGTAVGKAGLRSLALSLHKELAPEGIHVATVTVCGFIRPETPFDPAKIAEQYLRLHRQEAGAFEAEVVFRGA